MTAVKSNWIAVTSLVLAILTACVTAARSYGNETAATASRVTAVETRQVDEDRRIKERFDLQERWMERIEVKLDRALARP